MSSKKQRPEGHGHDTDTNPESDRDEAAAGEAQAAPQDTNAGEDSTGGESVTGMQELIAELRRQNAELADRSMRAVAEAENTRRRVEKDRQDAVKYGPSQLVKDLLPAIDNLRRALESVEAMQPGEPGETRSPDETAETPDPAAPPETGGDESNAAKALDNLLQGVSMTEKQLLDALERHGIRRLTPWGEAFSYDHHQAISEQADSGARPGTILQVLQAGYIMHDRLLRPAMVIVAKGEPKQGTNPPPDAPRQVDESV